MVCRPCSLCREKNKEEDLSFLRERTVTPFTGEKSKTNSHDQFKRRPYLDSSTLRTELLLLALLASTTLLASL